MKNIYTLCTCILIFVSFSGCNKPETDSVAAASEEVLGRNIVAWHEVFPLQTESNDRNHEEELSPTGYNGSKPFQRWDLTPEIKTNFAGIAFSKDYKEDRGHVYAWEDLFETVRTGPESPAACLTCKTSDVELVFAEEGWGYAANKLDGYYESAHAGMDCFTCHDPDSKHLRVIQPAYIEAVEANWKPLSELTEKEMRTAVCAQCHSEYYFVPDSKQVVFPWAEGLTPENMYTYYEAQPSGFTGDYTNPLSDTRLLKAQHPDFEMFQSGVHASAGVSCADCHMPRVTAVDETGESSTITQHWITSPLRTIEASCLTCHAGKSDSWILERVAYIQDNVFESLRRSGLAIEEAHKAIADSSMMTKELEEPRALLREAQWYWDFVASANSTGFHNTDLAMNSLNKAMDLAYKSIVMVALNQ